MKKKKKNKQCPLVIKGLYKKTNTSQRLVIFGREIKVLGERFEKKTKTAFVGSYIASQGEMLKKLGKTLEKVTKNKGG